MADYFRFYENITDGDAGGSHGEFHKIGSMFAIPYII